MTNTQESMCIRLISLHNIGGNIFDIAYQKIPTGTDKDTLFESSIVPGLFFDSIQLAITYKGNPVEPSKKVWQLLTLLETRGGQVSQDEIVDELQCSVRHVVDNTKNFLKEIGVTKPVFIDDKGKVRWD